LPFFEPKLEFRPHFYREINIPPLILFVAIYVNSVPILFNISDFLAHVSLATLPFNTYDIRNPDTGLTMPCDVKQVSDVIRRIIKLLQNISGNIFVRFGKFWGQDEGFGIHMALNMTHIYKFIHLSYRNGHRYLL